MTPCFFAGLGQTEKCVSAFAAAIASGSSADLALCHVVADGVFRCVGMERNLRAVEDDEQFGLAGMQALEQTVERDEAGALLKDQIEAGVEFRLGGARRGASAPAPISPRRRRTLSASTCGLRSERW